MTIGISKPSKYAAEWKKVRQTRLKASGMTALLEGLDRQWREYDAPYFVKNVMGNNALNDIKRNVDMIDKAKTDVAAIGARFTKDYDKKEKDFIKAFIADMEHELAFWKQTKRDHLLAGAGAEAARQKLAKTNEAYTRAFTDLQSKATKLELIYGKLTAADQLKDHMAPPAVIEQFRKSVDEFNGLWADTDARNEKRVKYALQANAAHDKKVDAPELLKLIKTIGESYSTDRRALNVMKTDAKIWLNWTEQHAAHH